MIVEEVMSPLPYVVRPGNTIAEAMSLLAETDVRHLPVVEDDELVGILSDRDLRQLTPSANDEFDHPGRVRRLFEQPVSTVMTGDVVTVYPEAELGEAIDLMIEHKIGAIPVVEAGSRKLVGIVSYVDALRAARDVI